LSAYADLIQADKEALRQLLARPGRQHWFLARLIVSIPKVDERDYQLMQRLGPPRANVIAYPGPRVA
jgi:hypothetical protein